MSSSRHKAKGNTNWAFKHAQLYSSLLPDDVTSKPARSSSHGAAHASSNVSSPSKDAKARDRGAIIESNKKTELCRNYPNCKYGSKCAFAHSPHELRRLSLAEMEQSGRIPNAAKFRCYPCLTWLSTGSCPYNDRCVFIHDPRVKGPLEAYLYATPGSNTSRQSAKSTPLYWPDQPVTSRNDNYASLFTASIQYEVHLKDERHPSFTELTVKLMWEHFVAVMCHLDDLGAQEPSQSLLYIASEDNTHLSEQRLPIFKYMSSLKAVKASEWSPKVPRELPGLGLQGPNTQESSPFRGGSTAVAGLRDPVYSALPAAAAQQMHIHVSDYPRGHIRRSTPAPLPVLGHARHTETSWYTHTDENPQPPLPHASQPSTAPRVEDGPSLLTLKDTLTPPGTLRRQTSVLSTSTGPAAPQNSKEQTHIQTSPSPTFLPDLPTQYPPQHSHLQHHDPFSPYSASLSFPPRAWPTQAVAQAPRTPSLLAFETSSRQPCPPPGFDDAMSLRPFSYMQPDKAQRLDSLTHAQQEKISGLGRSAYTVYDKTFEYDSAMVDALVDSRAARGWLSHKHPQDLAVLEKAKDEKALPTSIFSGSHLQECLRSKSDLFLHDTCVEDDEERGGDAKLWRTSAATQGANKYADAQGWRDEHNPWAHDTREQFPAAWTPFSYAPSHSSSVASARTLAFSTTSV